jgi:hypothetical protein
MKEFTYNNDLAGKKVSIRGYKKGNADCSTLPAIWGEGGGSPHINTLTKKLLIIHINA